jgi:hypothetical protein
MPVPLIVEQSAGSLQMPPRGSLRQYTGHIG